VGGGQKFSSSRGKEKEVEGWEERENTNLRRELCDEEETGGCLARFRRGGTKGGKKKREKRMRRKVTFPSGKKGKEVRRWG